MKDSERDIPGMPYFPGAAVGTLRRGMAGAGADDIVLLSQLEITQFNTLPAGLIVVEAAPFSHTLIGLLGLGVPTVLISAQQATSLEAGGSVMIDGTSGRIAFDVDAQAIARANRPAPSPSAGETVSLADGETVNLYASVRRPSLARLAVDNGARAIGLMRSEFLLPADGSVPDADFYRGAFRELCDAASPLEVTVRLLDVAADKIPDWLPHPELAGRALGLQGVRMYNMDPVRDVIAAQLAALDDLADAFPLRILLPFLVRVEELVYWRDRARQQLSHALPIGAMAETPATVLDIAALLQEADFVAIGCNDLMQGLFAADRDQAELRHYLDPYAPLLYRVFRQAAEQAREHLPAVQLCGVLSQIQGVLPVLLGLGYRTFSVDAPFIPHLAEVVRNSNRLDCERLAGEVCAATSTQEVLECLQLPTERHSPFLS